MPKCPQCTPYWHSFHLVSSAPHPWNPPLGLRALYSPQRTFTSNLRQSRHQMPKLKYLIWREDDGVVSFLFVFRCYIFGSRVSSYLVEGESWMSTQRGGGVASQSAAKSKFAAPTTTLLFWLQRVHRQFASPTCLALRQPMRWWHRPVTLKSS